MSIWSSLYVRHFAFKTNDYFRPSLPTVHHLRNETGASLSRLLAQINRLRKRHSRSGPSLMVGVVDRRQLCIVKVRYGRGSGSLRAHLSYIQRKGAGKEGERPELFGSSKKSDLTGTEADSLRHYRLVISPETPTSFPLAILATKLIQRIEADTGYLLSWVATVHENTEHTHVHLVIAGEDKKGRTVVFSRKYISSQMREHTRDILTEALGDRRSLPEALRLEKEIRANRFTSLDDVIQTASGVHGQVSAKSIRAVATPARADAALARLKFLQKVGLAEREGMEYRVFENWEKSLAISRRFASYLGASRQLRFTPPSLLRLYSPERDGRVVGRVSAIGLIDELSNNNYVVVETIDGRAFYVPLYRKPRGLTVGDSIVLMRASVSAGSETAPPNRRTQSTAAGSTSLLEVRFAKMPEQKLREEARRLGKRRGGFGLHLL